MTNVVDLDTGRPRVERAAALELPLLLAVPQAAKVLGISRSAAYRLAASGELASRRLGGRVYIVTDDLLGLVGRP